MDRNSQQIQRGRPVSGLDAAHANEYFEQFLNATSLKHILGYYRGLIDNLHLKPNEFPLFYPKLRANLTSWRAKALWKKFDARASHKCYQKGKLAGNTRVLIIGGGPCGMRTAIEAQLLGAKVVVIEKRDRFSRNNVLHLWPFVIEDLRMLGAKKFFGKFCAGAIDHISIRQLQCILLKVALLLGVEVHTEVSFEKLVEPNATEKTGWRAEVKPANHPVHHYEFDVIIGADGKRNTLQGFSRKEFRGKLAIAITANFINRKTEAEARVEEISGVAFIFNQKFFKDLQEETRIDLENIVYYKDDTHYFVMTAKKASLLEKGVIKEDLADTEKLLAPDNVDRKALEQYAIDAANFSTNYQLPNLEFAVNHYGQPDIAMFDFTSMYAAENASKVLERNGYKLLLILVGDSLLEPFWPTGSGCARGFLSSLDAAWAIRSWSLGANTALEVLAERESIYRLLAQTTPDNLNKDWKSYTVDPTTRYPNLNKTAVLPHQVTNLYDTDNPGSIEKMKRNLAEPTNEVPRKRRRGNVDNEILLGWLRQQLKDESDIEINDIESIFKGGKALCALIHHYRPDLLDYVAVKGEDAVKNNQMAFDILEKEIGIPPVMTGEEITKTEDYLTMASYLTEVYDTFRREIPHIKHPKLNPTSKNSKLPPYVETKPFPERPIVRTRNGFKKLSRCCNSIVNIPSSKSFKKKRRSILKSRNSSRERGRILTRSASKTKGGFKLEKIETNDNKKLKIRRSCGCLSDCKTSEINGSTFCDIPLTCEGERDNISDSGDSHVVRKTKKAEVVRNSFCDIPSVNETKKVISNDRGDFHDVCKTERAEVIRENLSNVPLSQETKRDEVNRRNFCDIPLVCKDESDIKDFQVMHTTERAPVIKKNVSDFPLGHKTEKIEVARNNFSDFSLAPKTRGVGVNKSISCDIALVSKSEGIDRNNSGECEKKEIIRNNFYDIPLVYKTEGNNVNDCCGLPSVRKPEKIKVIKKYSCDRCSVHKIEASEVKRPLLVFNAATQTYLQNEEHGLTNILNVDTSSLDITQKRLPKSTTKATDTMNYCNIGHFQCPKSRTHTKSTISSENFHEKPVISKSKGIFLEAKRNKNEIEDFHKLKFIMEPIKTCTLSDTCTETTTTDTIENFHVPMEVIPKSRKQLETKHIEEKIDAQEKKIAPKPPNFACGNGKGDLNFTPGFRENPPNSSTDHQSECVLNEIHRNVERCLKSMKKENNKPLRNFMTNLLLRRNKSAVAKCKCAENQNSEKDNVKNNEKTVETNQKTVQTPPSVPSNDTLITVKVIENTLGNKRKSIRNIEFIPSLNQLTISSKVDVCKSSSSSEGFQNKSDNSDLLTLLDKLGRMSGPKTKFTSRPRVRDSESYVILGKPPNNSGAKMETNESNPVLSNCQCPSGADSKKLPQFSPKSDMFKSTEEIERQLYNEMSNWTKSKDFIASADRSELMEEVLRDRGRDVASVSKVDLRNKEKSIEKFKRKCLKSQKMNAVKPLSFFSQYSPLKSQFNSTSVLPSNFSVITEGEEPNSEDLPESKKLGSELSFKTVKSGYEGAFGPPLRPSSRHKRHIEAPPNKTTSLDKKTRKRRTLEKVGSSVEDRLKTLEEIASNRAERQNRRRQQRKLQTEQFLKSMQMLQANAKADSQQPFEDYSIFLYRQTAPKFEDRVKDLEKQFTYVPDHDNKSALPSARSGGTDEDLAARIKTLEKKWTEQQPVDKKPKDLMRAIGKIETTDWNIKEIEKKILENKMGKPTKTFDKEKVPKWSKEQFLARQNKMESKHLDRQDSNEVKYADIDKSIKNLDQKLKEGSIRQLGTNKVASLTEKLVSKIPNEPKPPEKNAPKTPVVVSGGSEYCHFCRKRVYLMERLSAEGRFFHHSCFKCQYCNVQLRLGSYAFDRDGMYGFRFFCLHHFGMMSEIDQSRIARKSPQKLLEHKSPEKKPLPGIAGVDLLDRVQTPERVEFANLSTDHVSSDQDEPLSQIDEDEWTDKNFGASCAELGDSDEDSSSISDTDSDDEGAFDDALEEPITKEGTMKWAERWKNSYSKKRHKSESDDYTSSDQSSYYDSSDDDESDTATEGEEEIRARELRKQEVRVDPPVVQTDTGTDTEVKSSFQLSPPDYPDILSSHKYKSSDSASAVSGEYNSAESGDLDLNMNKIDGDNVVVGKLSIVKKDDGGKKVTRRNTIGDEFVSKFGTPSEPLLVIRRTPSKISLPKETKPKVAVNTNVLASKKYFGVSDKKPGGKKQTLQRSETLSIVPKKPLIKQSSLPETSEEKKDVESFNFEPKDEDLKDVDDYIEYLLANEEELHKPVDPDKYKIREETPPKEEREEGEVSSSIEDLMKALETETEKKDEEIVAVEPEGKLEDLLTWMDGLEHQTEDRKVYRSFSDAKYRNLEQSLKTPQRSASIINKIPKNNIAFFESHLAGKGTPRNESSDSDNDAGPRPKFGLKRSKTEITCDKSFAPRSSVDLDAVSKVDIKKMLRRFEQGPAESQPRASCSPPKALRKRNSFATFRTTSTDKEPSPRRFIPKPAGFKQTIEKFESGGKKNDAETAVEETLKDLKRFVEDTHVSMGEKTKEAGGWCANVTVSSTTYAAIDDSFEGKMQEKAEETRDALNNIQIEQPRLENKDPSNLQTVNVTSNGNQLESMRQPNLETTSPNVAPTIKQDQLKEPNLIVQAPEKNVAQRPIPTVDTTAHKHSETDPSQECKKENKSNLATINGNREDQQNKTNSEATVDHISKQIQNISVSKNKATSSSSDDETSSEAWEDLVSKQIGKDPVSEDEAIGSSSEHEQEGVELVKGTNLVTSELASDEKFTSTIALGDLSKGSKMRENLNSSLQPVENSNDQHKESHEKSQCKLESINAHGDQQRETNENLPSRLESVSDQHKEVREKSQPRLECVSDQQTVTHEKPQPKLETVQISSDVPKEAQPRSSPVNIPSDQQEEVREKSMPRLTPGSAPRDQQKETREKSEPRLESIKISSDVPKEAREKSQPRLSPVNIPSDQQEEIREKSLPRLAPDNAPYDQQKEARVKSQPRLESVQISSDVTKEAREKSQPRLSPGNIPSDQQKDTREKSLPRMAASNAPHDQQKEAREKSQSRLESVKISSDVPKEAREKSQPRLSPVNIPSDQQKETREKSLPRLTPGNAPHDQQKVAREKLQPRSQLVTTNGKETTELVKQEHLRGTAGASKHASNSKQEYPRNVSESLDKDVRIDKKQRLVDFGEFEIEKDVAEAVNRVNQDEMSSSGISETPEPMYFHDFARAVDSTDTSQMEDVPEASNAFVKGKFQDRKTIPHYFSKAVQSSSESDSDFEICEARNPSVLSRNDEPKPFGHDSVLKAADSSSDSESDGRVNVEDLYAKVNKVKPPYSPPVPRRLKKESKALNVPPIPPQRKRSGTSPSPQKSVSKDSKHDKCKDKDRERDSDKDCCIQ